MWQTCDDAQAARPVYRRRATSWMGRLVGRGACVVSVSQGPVCQWPVGSSPGALVAGEEQEEATVGRYEVGALPLSVSSGWGYQDSTPRPSQGALLWGHQARPQGLFSG